MTNHRKTRHFPKCHRHAGYTEYQMKTSKITLFVREINSIQRQLPISQHNQNKNRREGHKEGDSYPLYTSLSILFDKGRLRLMQKQNNLHLNSIYRTIQYMSKSFRVGQTTEMHDIYPNAIGTHNIQSLKRKFLK